MGFEVVGGEMEKGDGDVDEGAPPLPADRTVELRGGVDAGGVGEGGVLTAVDGRLEVEIDGIRKESDGVAGSDGPGRDVGFIGAVDEVFVKADRGEETGGKNCRVDNGGVQGREAGEGARPIQEAEEAEVAGRDEGAVDVFEAAQDGGGSLCRGELVEFAGDVDEKVRREGGVIVEKEDVRSGDGGEGAIAVGAEAAPGSAQVTDVRRLAPEQKFGAVVGAVVGDDGLPDGVEGGAG